MASTNLLLRPERTLVLPFQLTADANLNFIDALDFFGDLLELGGVSPAETLDW